MRSLNAIKAGAAYGLLALMSLVSAAPFLWALLTSLKIPSQIEVIPPVWIPDPIAWENWVEVFKLVPLALFLRNSATITLFAVLGQVVTASLVAYGFARFRFPGRDVLFLVMLSVIMLPRHVTLIPQYLLFNRLGWIDTYKPLVVPAYFGGGAFSIFLMRQFYLTIPLELDEAAKIDGASYVAIYSRIMLPLAKPALATVGVLGFLFHWNNFLEPLIYLNTTEKFPISIGLNFLRDHGQVASAMPVTTHYLMVASLLSTVPCLVLFGLAQRQFVQGIALTGVKG